MYLTSGLVEKTNESLKKSGKRHIIHIPSNSVRNITYKSRITNMATVSNLLRPTNVIRNKICKNKGKAVPVTGREGP
jgi:hypothetical protein